MGATVKTGCCSVVHHLQLMRVAGLAQRAYAPGGLGALQTQWMATSTADESWGLYQAMRFGFIWPEEYWRAFGGFLA